MRIVFALGTLCLSPLLAWAEPIDFRPDVHMPWGSTAVTLPGPNAGVKVDVEISGPENTHKSGIVCCEIQLLGPPGKYRLRSRGADSSEWSDWRDFSISYQPMEFVYPQSGEKITPFVSREEDVKFSGPIAPGAKGYFFEVQDEHGKTLHQEIRPSPEVTWTLPILSKYRWRILPVYYEGQERDVEPQFIPFAIGKPREPVRTYKLSATPFPNADHYEFEITVENKPPLVAKTLTSKTPETEAELPPGAVTVRSHPVFADGQGGNWGAPARFQVPFSGDDIESPKDGEVLDPERKRTAPVHLRWRALPGVEKYFVYFFDRDGLVIIKKETTANELEIRVPVNSTYGLFVQPYGYGEDERPVHKGQAEITFTMGSFVDDELVQPAEEPAHLYGWTGYNMSNVSYLSRNSDNNSLTTDAIPGGSVEAAVGYWHRKTRFGWQGFAELSGFEMENRKFLYPEIGLMAGRRYNFEGGKRLRVWAGVGHKEMPELLTEPGQDYLRVQDIGSYGYQVRASLLGPAFKDYSWFVLGNFYHSLMSSQTPNGLPLDYMDSYSVGIYISRTLGDAYRARIGYTYRWDESKYQSTRTTTPNQVTINGNYISFILEFSLQAPEQADD